MVRLDTDTLLDVLSNPYRRHILLSLHNRPQGEGIELPNAIATKNTDQWELEVKLRHSHLPKLATTELIEWDPEGTMVHRGPAFSEVRPVLEFIVEFEDEIPLDCLQRLE